MTTNLTRVALALALLTAGGAAARAAETTVYIDLIVEDAKGRPALNLQGEEIVVVQDGVRQTVASVVARETLGHYEIRYVPTTGTGGAVKLQVLRQGALSRGIDGPALKPRVVSPLEAELTALLSARPDAGDFRTHLSVMRFESTPKGLHHALTVEIPYGEIPFDETRNGPGGDQAYRIQVLARVLDAGGHVVHRSLAEPTVPGILNLRTQRLFWTGQAYLKPGAYTLETVVRDPATSKTAVRKLPFTAADIAPGLRVSSVALLMPANTISVRDEVSATDDPFRWSGKTLVPTLDLKTAAGPSTKVQFYAIVYPDAKSTDPVTLRLDLLRDGSIVGSAPVALPAADERGQIRYVGGLPVRTLPPADYTLRLHAQQGTAVSFEEAPFSVVADAAAAPAMRVDSVSAADAGAKPGTLPPDSPDLADGKKLLRRQQYDLAVQKLKKADKEAGGTRPDVAHLLAVAYYRMQAYKDAESAARRLIELSKDDPALHAEGYTVLGRTLADSEKKLVNKESDRLVAAVEAFRKVLEISGGGSETGHLGLAETFYRLDRKDDAQAALKTLAAKPGISDGTAERARQLLDNPRCATEPCLPALSFVTRDGRHVTSDELKGKVVMLSFWATWCGPCVAAMPELKRLHAKYENEPFIMVGVNRDNDRASMDKFVEANRVAWVQVTDDVSDRLSDSMAVHAIPAEILFDHEGVLIGRTRGWGSETGSTLIARIHDAIGKAKKAQRKTVSER